MLDRRHLRPRAPRRVSEVGVIIEGVEPLDNGRVRFQVADPAGRRTTITLAYSATDEATVATVAKLALDRIPLKAAPL